MHRGGERQRSGSRKKSVSEEELSDIYGGPTEFMEAGTRGFLITTLPKKEEFGVDDAIDLLRQTAIKVYGGYKPTDSTKQLEKKGYVKVDCLNMDEVKIWPHPGGEEEEQTEQTEKQDGEGGETAADVEMQETKEEEAEAQDDGDQGDTKEESGKAEEDEKKKDEKKDEKKERRRDSNIPRMHSIYKFKAYRTEMRNMMFIKSDVPDPIEVAEAAMQLVLDRNSVTGDAVSQLLPVIGICDFDYQQLEVMCRRSITPLFDESLQPQSFSVMLVDKLSEPGSEVVYEIVRNTIWAANPMAWMSSPIAEPDLVLRFELIGSKLVISPLKYYMKYRQYRPTLLVDMGAGEAEDDDGGWMSEEAKKILEEKRKERERQRELEKKKEESRQKERARKLEEAEARRKARDEERKERRDRERKDRDEKKSKSKKADDASSKKSKTKEESEEKEEAATTEETPPPKRQRVDSDVDDTPKDKAEEEEGKMEDVTNERWQDVEEEQEEVEEEKVEEEEQKRSSRSRRGTRAGKKS